jgi:hypothetical protein
VSYSGRLDVAQERPSAIDTTIAHSSRVYNWLLSGKDNFAADRALGRELTKVLPTARSTAVENRAFLTRAVTHLVADRGIRQILDIGAGIPADPYPHQEAQAIAARTRVVYVDNDPIVLTHGRALTVSSDEGRSDYIYGDLRQPQSILRDPMLLGSLDLTQPVALLIVGVLMLLTDDDEPFACVKELMDALPAGSYLAITHVASDFDSRAMAGAVAAAQRAQMDVAPRSRDEVARFFAGLELLAPGVAPVTEWHPSNDDVKDPGIAPLWAGIARKP